MFFKFEIRLGMVIAQYIVLFGDFVLGRVLIGREFDWESF